MTLRASALREIPWSDPFVFYGRLKPSAGGALLESARAEGPNGRWSVAAAAPFLTLEATRGLVRLRDAGGIRETREDVFEVLRGLLAAHAAEPVPGVPFAGGAIGVVAYEAKHLIETGLPRRAAVPEFPDLHFQFFDEGAVFDHAQRRAYVFACARSRGEVSRRLDALERRARIAARRAALPASAGTAAPLRVRESMGRRDFERNVRAIKRHIRLGDVFQANLSQRLTFPAPASARPLYAALKRVNPSPFFGLYETGGFQVVCGSPERLVKLGRGRLETRPIAGTRPRGRTAEEDTARSLELLLSEKERAEHVMLVDLERNDLGRVAEYGSVSVDELMTVEEYSHVKHIVSGIRADLREGFDAVDALKAVFPGGTITGAPKVRCMEILDALEPHDRGPYTGSLGYVSFSGDMDFNIIIRSLVLKDGLAHLQTGAGIVADSDPEKEYDETLYKAQGVLAAVFGPARARGFLARRGVAARAS